jgi:hypothetical protein
MFVAVPGYELPIDLDCLAPYLKGFRRFIHLVQSVSQGSESARESGAESVRVLGREGFKLSTGILTRLQSVAFSPNC